MVMEAPGSEADLGLGVDRRALAWLEAAGTPEAWQQAREIGARLDEARVTVGVVGQFKRGKTSLVNCWLGEDVLPVGVLPTTGVVTRVRRGPRARAEVRYRDGRVETVAVGEVVRYASESHNPGNLLAVREIAVESAAASLPDWLEIVDTPGIGSTFTHATESARAYLPWIDLCLFVLSPEPPLSIEERSYLAQARDHAAKVVVLLTKSDSAPPEDVRAVAEFARSEIARALGSAPPVHTVSTRGEEARARTRQLLDDLVRTQSRQALAREGSRRRIQGFLAAQLALLRLEAAAWETPLQERQQRADRLAADLEQLARIRADQDALWGASRRAAGERVDDALAEVKAALVAEVSRRAEGIEGRPASVRAALFDHARTQLEAWRERLRPRVRSIAAELIDHRLRSLNAEVRPLVEHAAGLLGVESIAFEIRAPIREDRSFYFAWDDDPALLPDLRLGLAAFLPGGRARARSAAAAAVHDLIDRNVGRLRYAFRTAVESTLDDARVKVGRQVDLLQDALSRTVAGLRTPPDAVAEEAHQRLLGRMREGEALLAALSATVPAVGEARAAAPFGVPG
jgi:GTP-binding protein EngB required for normal cell division